MDFENVIDETSILANQPSSIKKKLYQYQLATLYHALNLERLQNVNTELDNNSIMIESNMGVIANKVGSGKSLIALSIIENDNIKYPDYKCSFVLENNLVREYTKTTFENHFKVNIIVVPHNLITQWSVYIEEDTKLSYKILSKKKELNAISEKLQFDENYKKIVYCDEEINDVEFIKILESYLNDTKIFLISSTYFTYFVDLLYSLKIESTISFERIFYDEADSINLVNNKKLEAKFYWFISSSIKNLKYPIAQYKYVKSIENEDTQYIRYKLVKDGGIQKNGFIKNSFESLKKYKNNSIIYLKCDDEFINTCIKLPNIISKIIKVKSPIVLQILKNIATIEIKRLIGEGDIIGAINKLNCNKGKTCDIVKIFTHNLTNTLEDKKNMLELINKKNIITEEIRENKISKLNSEINDIKTKIKYIKERVEGKHICPIGGDEIICEAYTPCCNNCFELENIIAWLEFKQECPTCRADLQSKDLVIKQSKIVKTDKFTQKKIKIEKTKYDEIMDILSKLEHQERRILIFSENTNTFQKLEYMLKKNNIKYSILNGNNNKINKIMTDFKDETSNTNKIILMNAKNYGCGLNLEVATDLILMHYMNDNFEKQVIGRAQRAGRTGSLNVWKVLYDDENYT